MPRPRLLLLLMLVLGLALSGQAGAQLVGGLTGFCWQGGVSATTQGLPSTNKLQGIIPSCTVTVYLTGTQTLATLYADSSLTPLANPFTATNLASVAPGQWIFNAAQNAAYDVVLSGGIAPNVYHAPVTIKGLPIGLGGGGSSLPIDSVQFALANGAFGSDPAITIDPVAHAFKVAGAGTSVIQQCGGAGGACVNLTVDPATNQWTFVWPPVPPAVTPTGSAACLTAITSGTTVLTATAAFAACTQPLAYLTNTLAPPQVVNAADFGAICNYSHDDTAAINAAISASTNAFAFNLIAGTKTAMVIKLPQGSCRITAPLKFGVYGALQGQGQSSYLIADYANWVGSDHNMIEIVANGALPGGNTSTPRPFGHLTMIGLGDATIPDAEAVKVVNNANTYGQEFQFGQLSFEDMAVSQLDTAFDLQDAVNTQLSFVWVTDVRIAANLNGDVIQTFFDHDYFQVGSAIGTSQTTPAYGLLVQGNNKYNSGCAIHTFTCEPQGVFFHDSSIVSFDYNVDIEWCIECDIHDNTIDVPASGITGTGADIQLGGFAAGGGLWILNNYMGAEKANTFIINSVFAFEGLGSDGIWIQNNEIFSNVDPGTTAGIVFAGSGPIESVHVLGNELRGLNKGISIGQNILNSEFRGNTGNTLTNELIDLANSGSPDFTGTIFESNTVAATNSVPVFRYGGATNFQVGYNWSPLLITGTFTAHGTGCTFSAGTIGTACAVTMSNPFAFPDTNYVIAGCSVNGAAAGHSYISTVSPPSNGGVFSVAETASDTTSTGGGQVYCQIFHE